MHAQVIRLIHHFQNTQLLAGAPIDSEQTRSSVSGKPAPESTSLPLILHQLTQSLLILRSMTAQSWDSPAVDPGVQTRCIALQRHARQAEAAMHRLRSLPLATPSVVIDLAQALTVLVLAADMLVQGQLASTTDPDTYALVRRSADRAMRSLVDVQTQLAISV
jgi:hypothetical protein